MEALDAAVFDAIGKQTGMSFFPSTSRYRSTEKWITSLTSEQKREVISAVEECHENTHPSYNVVNDALSLIAAPERTDTLFLMLRYREAFASPWKLQHGHYTTAMRYINGMMSMTTFDLANCTGEDFAKASALIRFAHDVGSNPEVQHLDLINHYRDHEAAGGVTAFYTESELCGFVSENYEHVDMLVDFVATRMSADIELMSTLIAHDGSRALTVGLL